MKKKLILILLILLFPINILAYEIDVNSNNVFMYNLDTNEVIYEKNSNDKVLIASLTKIMTTIVALENIKDLDEKVIITNEILSYISDDLSIVGFDEGEEVTYRDLLYGSLLPSGADATHTLAYYISGSEEDFVSLMNEKAKELEMNNTNFTNSIGIEPDSNNHYSSAKDMYKLLTYAIENEEFLNIFTTDEYKTSNKLHKLTSSKYKVSKNNDIDLSVIKGGKTGYTSKAHLCLASISSKDKTNLLLITIGSDEKVDRIGHYNDSVRLYNYFYDNYSNKNILESGKDILTLKTIYNDDVIIKQKDTIKKYIKDDSKITYEYIGTKQLDVGTKKGDIIGKYIVKKDGEKIYEEKIYSPVNVNYRIPKIYILFSSLLFLLIVFVLKLRKKIKKVEKYKI